MTLIDLATGVLLVAGCAFFLAGSVGLVRFPDVYCRLHALTKADNIGLGLIIIGLAIQAETPLYAVKLLLIWVLVLISSAGACHLLARNALRTGLKPWRKP